MNKILYIVNRKEYSWDSDESYFVAVCVCEDEKLAKDICKDHSNYSYDEVKFVTEISEINNS